MHELRQDEHHAQYMKEIGWRVEISPRGIGAYVKRLPLTGLSVMKIQRVQWSKLDFNWVKKLSQKHRVITTYIEVDERVAWPVEAEKINPENFKDLAQIKNEMKKLGYRSLKMGMVSSKTQVVDLTKSEKEILAQMKTKTRYNIGLAQKRGLRSKIWTGKEMIANPEALKTYLSLIKQNNKRVGYWGGQESWIRAQLRAFANQAYLIAATDGGGGWLAASLFLAADKTSYYAHNGSTEQGRRDMAPSLVVWEGMKEAKKRKLENLDFDGVFDERYPVKRWLGYTRFKAGFGGNYIYYPPAFEKWFTWWR